MKDIHDFAGAFGRLMNTAEDAGIDRTRVARLLVRDATQWLSLVNEPSRDFPNSHKFYRGVKSAHNAIEKVERKLDDLMPFVDQMDELVEITERAIAEAGI